MDSIFGQDKHQQSANLTKYGQFQGIKFNRSWPWLLFSNRSHFLNHMTWPVTHDRSENPNNTPSPSRGVDIISHFSCGNFLQGAAFGRGRGFVERFFIYSAHYCSCSAIQLTIETFYFNVHKRFPATKRRILYFWLPPPMWTILSVG